MFHVRIYVFRTVLWPFYAFMSPGRPVNISGQEGGKIGFLVVLEALAANWGALHATVAPKGHYGGRHYEHYARHYEAGYG
jgi:hypothetical protein